MTELTVYNVLRWIVLIETTAVLLAYVWAGYELLRQPRPDDRVMRAMRLGRLCRVGAVILTLSLSDLAIVNRFDKSVVTWQLIPWQLIIFGFAGAWILLDRTHYYPARHNDKASAAGRALLTLAEREER